MAEEKKGTDEKTFFFLPISVHIIEDLLEFRLILALVDHGQVVAEGAQTGLELLVVQLPGTVFVIVPVTVSHFQLHFCFKQTRRANIIEFIIIHA